MSILCKLFGHKHQTQRGIPHIRRSGWEQDYNEAYNMVEFECFCERCSKQIPIGIYSEPKKNINE